MNFKHRGIKCASIVASSMPTANECCGRSPFQRHSPNTDSKKAHILKGKAPKKTKDFP
jgi:hypothetical protein